MSSRTITKLTVGAIAGAALLLAALPGTAARASDGEVDGRDFLVWQRGGSPAPAQSLLDDADDADGTSQSGYNTWRTNFGRTY